MSLLDCIERVSDDNAPSADEEVERLRQALFARLGTERIAAFSAQGAKRAHREVTAALELELMDSRYAHLSESARQSLIDSVADSALGLGPIEGLLEDPSVTEIMVNGIESVYVEREGRLARSDVAFSDLEQLRSVIDRIVAPVGRRVDEQSPMVSAHLPQGHRANVVVEPIAADGPALTIRKFRQQAYSLDELVERGSMDHKMAQLLSWAVKARKNIAVCGGTGGGKTTLLNALSAEIEPTERIITIEDSLELRFDSHPHVVRLEARGPNLEGQGEITIRDLVTNALRMRPDRIVVGECRGAETLDMLQAMTTGHDGSMTTLHANSPTEVVARLVMMSRFGIELPVEVIEEQIASALDLIVQQDRFPDGTRKVTAIVEVLRKGRQPDLKTLVSYDRHTKSYEYGQDPTFLEDLVFLGVATDQEVTAWGK